MRKEHLLGFGAAVAIVFFAVAIISYIPADDNAEEDIVFQTAPLEWLMNGQYNGTIPYGEVMKHGDTGLGTFDKLDGEMVAVDGVAYQVTTDGKVSVVEDGMTAPFAEVTAFSPDVVVMIDRPMSYSEIQDYILGIIPSTDTINTIRLDGKFSNITTRSVPAQDYPYRPLEEIIPDQTIFYREDVEGTAAGFWHPDYMDKVNTKGFHMHFISSDRDFGGHILDFTMNSGYVTIDPEGSYSLLIPWDETDLP